MIAVAFITSGGGNRSSQQTQKTTRRVPTRLFARHTAARIYWREKRMLGNNCCIVCHVCTAHTTSSMNRRAKPKAGNWCTRRVPNYLENLCVINKCRYQQRLYKANYCCCCSQLIVLVRWAIFTCKPTYHKTKYRHGNRFHPFHLDYRLVSRQIENCSLLKSE